MLTAYTGTAIRAAEQPLLDKGLGEALMQRAAHGLAMGVLRVLRERHGGYGSGESASAGACAGASNGARVNGSPVLGARIYGARVAVLAGSGNNGGDALFAAAMLASRGVRTTALLTSARTHPDALAAFERAGGRVLNLAGALEERGSRPDSRPGSGSGAGSGSLPDAIAAEATEPALSPVVEAFLAEAAACDVIIDGLLGTGGKGGLREPAAAVVRSLQLCLSQMPARRPSGQPHGLRSPYTPYESPRPAVVACDLPSGVDADTGALAEPVLRADLTVTFGAAKVGLMSAPGEAACGRVDVVDIGLGEYLPAPALRRLGRAEMAALLPHPRPADHKYTRGVAGIVAGSGSYPGAALLAVAAASACGPGMVRYVGPESVAGLVHVRHPEVVCSQGSVAENKAQAWLVGPGIDGSREQEDRALDAVLSGLPMVVDAGALPLIGAPMRANVVLTPHAGELSAHLARLGVTVARSEIEANTFKWAVRASGLTGATVLLKGATTVVASPSGAVFSQSDGNARLATAGSGDTLAGILVSLMAMLGSDASAFERQGIAAADMWAAIAAMAASLHGRLAGDVSEPLSAGMLAARIPEVWRRIVEG